jgi:nicotinate-nucleotide adenylyltransferase
MPTPDSGTQWGIFGGAFDPVHNGHLTLARDILRATELNGILFVPSFNPPLKRRGCVASFEDRVAMLKMAIDDCDRFAVSEIEAKSDEPGYTLHTVRALKKRFPRTIFSFIIGADLLMELESWYEAEEIAREVQIIAGTRPGATLTEPAGFPKDAVTMVETTPIELASHQIRAVVAAGITVTELSRMIPPAVAKFVLERGLYR